MLNLPSTCFLYLSLDSYLLKCKNSLVMKVWKQMLISSAESEASAGAPWPVGYLVPNMEGLQQSSHSQGTQENKKRKSGSLYKTQRKEDATIIWPKHHLLLSVQYQAEVIAALQLSLLCPGIQLTVLVYHFHTATPTTLLLEEDSHQPRAEAGTTSDLFLKCLFWIKVHGRETLIPEKSWPS